MQGKRTRGEHKRRVNKSQLDHKAITKRGGQRTCGEHQQRSSNQLKDIAN